MFTNLLHFYLKFLLDRQGVLVCLLLCFVKLQFLLFLFALCYFNIQWHWQRQKILLLVRLTSLLCCLLLSSLNSSFTTTFHLTTTLIHMSKGVCVCLFVSCFVFALHVCVCVIIIFICSRHRPVFPRSHIFIHSPILSHSLSHNWLASSPWLVLLRSRIVLACFLALLP